MPAASCSDRAYPALWSKELGSSASKAFFPLPLPLTHPIYHGSLKKALRFAKFFLKSRWLPCHFPSCNPALSNSPRHGSTGTGFVPARTKKRAAYAARWRRLFFSFRPSAADGAAVRGGPVPGSAGRTVGHGLVLPAGYRRLFRRRGGGLRGRLLTSRGSGRSPLLCHLGQLLVDFPVVFTCITSSRISSYPTRSRMGPTARITRPRARF